MPLVQIPTVLGAGISVTSGSGSPEGIVTAGRGSKYLQTDRGTTWRKLTASGNTGWIRDDLAVFNVKDYGAKADGSDDTSAIQAAIDAANTAGGGIVFVPAGSYTVTTLKFYSLITIRGAGASAGGSAVSQIYQPSATAPILQPNNPAVSTKGFAFEDIALSAFGNTNNTGGIDLTGCALFDIDRVHVSGCKVYGIRVIGISPAGSNGFANISRVVIQSMDSAATAWLFGSNTTTDQPDAMYFYGCYTNATCKFIGYTGPIGGNGPGNHTWVACRFEGGSSAQTLIDSDARGMGAIFYTCRFELFGGNATLNLVGTAFTGGVQFYGTTISTSGGTLTINDTGAVPTQWFGCGASAGGVGRYPTQLGYAILNRTKIAAAGASFTPNLGEANDFVFPANANPTINAMFTTGFPANQTNIMCITIKNTTGGAITTTWNAFYHLAGAWVDPAAGKQRSIWFRYDQAATLAYEISRSAADVTT